MTLALMLALAVAGGTKAPSAADERDALLAHAHALWVRAAGLVLEPELAIEPSPVRVGVVAVKARGALDRAIVRRIVQRRLILVEWCYLLALARAPALRGTVSIAASINDAGHIAAARVDDSAIGDEVLGACIEREVLRWKFPHDRRTDVRVRISVERRRP